MAPTLGAAHAMSNSLYLAKCGSSGERRENYIFLNRYKETAVPLVGRVNA